MSDALLGKQVLLDKIVAGLPWDHLRKAVNPAQTRLTSKFLNEKRGIVERPKPDDDGAILSRIATPLIMFLHKTKLVRFDDPLKTLKPEEEKALIDFLGGDVREICYVLHFLNSRTAMDAYIRDLHAIFTLNTDLPAMDIDLADVLEILRESAFNPTEQLQTLRNMCLLIIRHPFGNLPALKAYADVAAALFERRRLRGFVTVFVESMSNLKSASDIARFMASRNPHTRFDQIFLDPSTHITHSFQK